MTDDYRVRRWSEGQVGIRIGPLRDPLDTWATQPVEHVMSETDALEIAREIMRTVLKCTFHWDTYAHSADVDLARIEYCCNKMQAALERCGDPIICEKGKVYLSLQSLSKIGGAYVPLFEEDQTDQARIEMYNCPFCAAPIVNKYRKEIEQDEMP